jgi:hypothetical protein
MYTILLAIHSYLRWIVLAAAVIAVVRAASGASRRRGWEPGDEAASRWFVIGLDTQALLGIIIYLFLSPFTMSGWSDMGDTMRNAPLRFIVVEHQVGMFIALALAHIGRSRARKAADAARRHRTTLVFYSLALVAMLLSIPWPFMPGGRELFRGTGF